jgi:cation transport protein ChaC
MALWVFGYGSLMWNAGFPVAERSLATLSGHARSFCMWSVHHRGTESEPGLVLALDPKPGATVTGLALRDGREVDAVTFVVDTGHRQYCSGLSLEQQARVIATAVGGRGPNTEYLWNTVSHLHDLGIPDADLDWLAHRVRELAP